MFKKLRKKIEEDSVTSVVPGKPVRLSSEEVIPAEQDSIVDSTSIAKCEDFLLNDTKPSDYEGKPQLPGHSEDDLTPRRAVSKGSTSAGWLGSGLSAMIRGDTQMVADLVKDKDKLESALERQQDLMMQRLKEQEDSHQKKLTQAVEEALASKQQEIEEALVIISDLKLQVSVLETERNEYNLSASRLEEECLNLKEENAHLVLQLEEREIQLNDIKLRDSIESMERVAPTLIVDSASGFRSVGGVEKAVNREPFANVELQIDRSSSTPVEKEESSDQVACKEDGEARLDVELPEMGRILRTVADVVNSNELFSQPAILQVRQRDVQWTEDTSYVEAVKDSPKCSACDGKPFCSHHADLMCKVQALSEENQKIEDEMTEKNKVIKVQQQKIVDLKRTLQKELRPQESVPPVPTGSTISLSNYKSSGTPELVNDVGFQYLKHVVFKYMCSEGEEARYLVKAIATFLKFTPQEEKFVKEFMDYKVSWFGSKPYIHNSK